MIEEDLAHDGLSRWNQEQNRKGSRQLK